RPRQAWARRAFVVGQVAASVTLLVTALLFARSLHAARGLDPGFDVERVHVSRIDLSLRPPTKRAAASSARGSSNRWPRRPASPPSRWPGASPWGSGASP